MHAPVIILLQKRKQYGNHDIRPKHTQISRQLNAMTSVAHLSGNGFYLHHTLIRKLHFIVLLPFVCTAMN